jgi:hypothetical protein
MNLPEPYPLPFSTLIDEIGKGIIKIPQFQRDFVWERERARKLIDSIVKGYPIGTFIIWKTKERLRSIRNIGGVALPEPPGGDFVQYVLDGQQRMTSIFTVLKGLTIKREGGEEDYSKMYVDLTAGDSEDIVVTDTEGRDEKKLVMLKDLLRGKITQFSKFSEDLQDKIDIYRLRIQSYNFSSVLVKEAPLDVATEIFTRLNIGGKPLTVFEIMVAKTYDSERGFDLAEKYGELSTDLAEVSFETISPATVLQAVSVLLVGECQKKDILSLRKEDFIGIWEKAADCIRDAIDYFRSFYRIPVSRLLPYNALIIPFTYFFYKKKKRPTGDAEVRLKDFFWRCSLSGRYSHSLESRLAQDIKRIDKILDDKLPTYDFGIDTSPEFIQENGWFSASRSYIKAILCVLAQQRPKSFDNNADVIIANNWLKQANSKNYHHFFPKAYMEKQGKNDPPVNHILNITIVDDFLNKREIKTNAPATYLRKFKKDNPKLDKTMKSHLIDDLEEFGVWENDYQKFFDARAKRVNVELQSRIIPRKIDNRGQSVMTDDYEEGEEPEAA